MNATTAAGNRYFETAANQLARAGIAQDMRISIYVYIYTYIYIYVCIYIYYVELI